MATLECTAGFSSASGGSVGRDLSIRLGDHVMVKSESSSWLRTLRRQGYLGVHARASAVGPTQSDRPGEGRTLPC